MNFHSTMRAKRPGFDVIDGQTSNAFLPRIQAGEVIERTNQLIERTRRQAESFRESNPAELPWESTQSSSFNDEALEADVVNVIRFSAPRTHPERPTISIVAVQEWEGSIDCIEDDVIEATMVDVSADSHRPTERMQIPLSLIDDEDRQLLAPGVIFRLVIGRERRRGGQIQNKTLVYVRRNQFRQSGADIGEDFGRMMAEWS